MAQSWQSAPVAYDPRRDERERAETRYRNVTGDTNPLAQPVILPGEEGYAGGGQYVPEAGVVVRGEWASAPVATDSQIRADRVAAERVAQGDALRSGGGALQQGLQLGFADELAGRIAGLGQMASNAYRTATGQPIEINSADLQAALTSHVRGEQNRFAQERPVSNIALQGAGGLLTGGGAIGSGLRGAVATGAAYGAGYGGGTAEGGLLERAPAAAIGGAVGGVTGGLVQAGGQAAAPYISRIAGIARAPARNFTARRNAGPAGRAAMRFVDTLDPQAAASERARLQALGVQPSLIDVTGNTTERLVRSAAGPAGPAAEAAVSNAIARQANLKPEISAATRGLSPVPGTADQFVEGLTATRGRLANEMYAPAYEARVPVTQDVVSVLADEPGRAALRRARAAAVARQNEQQVAEIDALLSGSPPGEVSAGTLDRVRIAMAGRGEAFNRRPDTRDIAGGLFSRAGQIDQALEQVPELAPARETYRNISGAIDAVGMAPEVFSTAPEDFARRVAGLTDEQRQAMIVGVRQEILDTLGGQRNAGTGFLQTVSESPYARQNLEALLGPDEASQYIEGIRARIQQSQRAQRVSPNTNSQTFGRAMDEDTFSAANMIGAGMDVVQGARGNVVAIGRVIDRIRARATMSPEERQAIAEIGLGSADELERVIRLADEARTQGRRTPREVRAYILRTRNVLGSQSPEALQLERILLPAPVAASEEEQ